jgi:hypothetical protein
MNAKSRRKLEMGKRALEFSRAHPDQSVGYTAAVDRLADRLQVGDQLALQQRDGLLEVRAATRVKRELKKAMAQTHLRHLAQAARLAGREAPAIAEKFAVPPAKLPYASFRTAAGAVAAEAEGNADLLRKYGLAEPVFASLKATLEQFDAAVERGSLGRRAHVGASADLDNVAAEVVALVGLIDGMNRIRFAGEPELVAEWVNASDVRATPVKASPQEGVGGEVRPAA